MSTNTVRGTIQKCNQKTAYDRDGNEFKQTWITVDGTEYSAKLPRNLYLDVGMEVLLALKQGSPTEASDGYCVKMGYHWGENWKALQGQIAPDDRLEYIEGTVTEKRKSTDGAFDMTRSIINQTRISYTILIGEQQFHATQAEGEWLQIGMEIALVRKENEVVLIMDKKSGKFSQVTKPYFILFLALIGGLIAAKVYLLSTGAELPPVYAVIVLSIFLFLFGVLNVLSYNAFLQHKRFLQSKLRG
jgi:hypothetical protein